MKSGSISRRVLLKSSTAVAAGLVLSPAIIGRAQAATMKMKCSSSLPNDPKYANGRVYYDNLVKHLKGTGSASRSRSLLSRQPARPGNRRHQFGQARRHRPDGVGLVDLGQSGAARRHLRPRLSLHQLSAADQGVRAGAAKPIEEALLKGANIRIISWAYNFGSRSVLAKKPVKGPEDLAGLKIRTLPNPVITECLRLMGAAATPLAFGEIYTALQAGVLDGLEHDPPTILASKFYETRNTTR
jgi:TRAP-type C4-dicarboxylate transport system, periplasmic component